MATWDTTGEDALRAENVDKVIKGITERNFLMKQLVMTPKSTSWLETYYTESATPLTAKSGIPRGAKFPVANMSWTKNTAYMKKHGLAADVLHEDIITNNIDVILRTQLGIAKSVNIAVDQLIYDALVAGAGNTKAASATWSNSTRSSRIPHEDMLLAKMLGYADYYNYDFAVMHPTTFGYFASNDYVLDSFDAAGPRVLKTGMLERFEGLDILVTPIATAATVLMGQSKVCGTYRLAEALRTVTERIEGEKVTIKAWEIGACFVTDPDALCTITGAA